MKQIFTIQDNKIVIDALVLNKTEGSVVHTGTMNVDGDVTLVKDLKVNGSITVDTLNVKNLKAEISGSEDSGKWVSNLEEDLLGKGLSWTWGNGHITLAYQTGNRLKLSGGNLDLAADQSYKIDNTDVVSLNALGVTVTKSNLKEVGTLKSLNVTGDTTLAEFAFFGSGFGRLGLNTDEPNGTLSVVENDVEVVIRSPEYGRAQVGTYTTHDLAIITDNTDRIVVKNDGKVIFGDPKTKTAEVTIYGTLNVETLVTDNRMERYSSLEIKSSRDTNIYGKGIVWTGNGSNRQLVMLAEPDRLWSSEPIDLAGGNCYFINGRPVLSENSLGDSILHSKLSTVGALESLTVRGETTLEHTLNVISFVTTPKLISPNLSSDTEISININSDEAFYADHNEISIGNKNNSRKPLKLFGPVSVGISSVEDPDADLTVKGSIKFSGKKFITGLSAPVEGNFNKGDICWNEDPKLHGNVGWVCTASGAPGVWNSFGAIGAS